MTCSLLDVPCHIWGFIAPFWFWIQVAFWVIAAGGALWALSMVKNVAGWPGVAAVGGFALYVFGFIRGKRGESFNPIENIEPGSPDAAPSPRKPKVHVRRTAKRTPGKRVYDASKNEWVEK